MVTIPISWQLDSNVRPPLGAQWFVACSVGMGVCFAVLGTRHPLVAHPVRSRAVELACRLLRFRLGRIHRRNGPVVALLGAGDSRKAGECQGDQKPSVHGVSEGSHHPMSRRGLPLDAAKAAMPFPQARHEYSTGVLVLLLWPPPLLSPLLRRGTTWIWMFCVPPVQVPSA